MVSKQFALLASLTVLLLSACGGRGSVDGETRGEGEKVPMKYAVNLSLTRHPGYVEAEMRNPWDTTKMLHRYLLVPDSADVPVGLPAGTVVRTPLSRSLVYSSVHNSLITELGAIEAIGGVCDASYIHDSRLAGRIAKGIVEDCGNSMSPNMEKIMRLNPGAILLSPYENSGNYGKLGQLGIPIVECADYMERSPLGRAEWMKFFGILFGKEELADSLFADTEREYLALKGRAAEAPRRPKVIADCLYGSAWYVPGKRSTMGIFIEDAGGENPFAYLDVSGSEGLVGEQVLHKGADADVWFVRYHQDSDKDLAEFGKDSQLYPRFKAFKERNVYGCNTMRTPYYEEVPFHPQWLLANFVAVMHPEVGADTVGHSYFSKMN